MVDKDRIEGAAQQAKGAVKKGVGNVTGDEKMKAKGEADNLAGKAKSTVGGAKDAARDAVDKDRT